MRMKTRLIGAVLTLALSATLATPALAVDTSGFPAVQNVYQPGVTSAPYSSSFTDVTPDAWYYDAVMTLTEGGLLAGYGNGKYGPNDPLTREQVHIIQHRITSHLWSMDVQGILNYSSFTNADMKSTADRAFAIIMLMDRAMGSYREIQLNDRTIINKTILSDFETFIGADSKYFDEDFTVDRGYASQDKYGTRYPWATAEIPWGVYDTIYAKALQGQKFDNLITSIDEFPDAAEIRRWLDENAELMRNHLYENVTLEWTKSYCEKLIVLAYNVGLFSGADSAGSMAPYAPVTRGQVAQMLFNTGWTYAECFTYGDKGNPF